MPTEPPTVVSALAAALRSDPGRPLVTMYDDATGERVELSLKTFDNWVCKLANLFTAEWELAPGDLVAIEMPPHWQAMVAAVGAWTAGLTVCLDPAESVAASVVGPSWQGDPSRAGQVLACSLLPLGRAFAAGPPAGALDWTAEVPAQPDVLLLPQPVSAGDQALVTAGGSATHGDLFDRGSATAEKLGLAAGGRLLTDWGPVDPTGIDVSLLAPLVTQSSVVLLVNAPASRREAIAAQELVTCTSWRGPPPADSSGELRPPKRAL
jgi:uncharacterized protein (TIGR03089 family)